MTMDDTGMNLQICRHCFKRFNPTPGKPGYIDECPKCLHEKTTPEGTASERRFVAQVRKVEKELEKIMRKAKVDENVIRNTLSEIEPLFRRIGKKKRGSTS
jgi:hypothetical protein